MPENKNYLHFIVTGLLLIAVIILAGFLFNPELRQLAGITQNISNNGNIIKPIEIVDEQSAVIDVVDSASPAVVSIAISQDVPVLEQYYSNPFQSNDPFGFFDNFSMPQYRQNGTEKKQTGAGTGFIVSADGLILTNKHVVSSEDAEYTVILNDADHTKYTATVLDRDPTTDLAVLKIEADDLPYLELADSDQNKVGQTVIAIGFALGQFDNTVTKGVVSGMGRSITAGGGATGVENLEGVIQTDAAINPGNSGGPLLNLDGQVVGVNVAVASGVENIGFALPSNLAKTVVESVQESGRIVRPYLGIRYVLINDEIKKENNLNVDYGALIVRGETTSQLAVMPGSPADKADLKEGDIILEINGQKINKDQSLALLLKSQKVGDQIEFKILSKGEEITKKITLEEWPD